MPETDPKPDMPDTPVDPDPNAPEAPAETEMDAAEAEESPVATLEAEVAQLKDQLLRALAETENVRRRAERERNDAQKYAAAPVLKDLLGVADNLSRAIASVPEDAAEGDERLATLLDGVKLTEKELVGAFARHNVVKLEPLGEPLDPHRHEAMFEVPDPAQASGTVVQVIQPGYLLHDRLLRPARVGVAKAAAPAAADSAAADSARSDAEGKEPPQPGSRVDTSA